MSGDFPIPNSFDGWTDNHFWKSKIIRFVTRICRELLLWFRLFSSVLSGVMLRLTFMQVLSRVQLVWPKLEIDNRLIRLDYSILVKDHSEAIVFTRTDGEKRGSPVNTLKGSLVNIFGNLVTPSTQSNHNSNSNLAQAVQHSHQSNIIASNNDDVNNTARRWKHSSASQSRLVWNFFSRFFGFLPLSTIVFAKRNWSRLTSTDSPLTLISNLFRSFFACRSSALIFFTLALWTTMYRDECGCVATRGYFVLRWWWDDHITKSPCQETSRSH